MPGWLSAVQAEVGRSVSRALNIWTPSKDVKPGDPKKTNDDKITPIRVNKGHKIHRPQVESSPYVKASEDSKRSRTQQEEEEWTMPVIKSPRGGCISVTAATIPAELEDNRPFADVLKDGFNPRELTVANIVVEAEIKAPNGGCISVKAANLADNELQSNRSFEEILEDGFNQRELTTANIAVEAEHAAEAAVMNVDGPAGNVPAPSAAEAATGWTEEETSANEEDSPIPEGPIIQEKMIPGSPTGLPVGPDYVLPETSFRFEELPKFKGVGGDDELEVAKEVAPIDSGWAKAANIVSSPFNSAAPRSRSPEALAAAFPTDSNDRESAEHPASALAQEGI